MNLHEEEQVDYIMKYLPDLDHLNGLEVDRDDEEEEEESEDDEQEVRYHDENEQPVYVQHQAQKQHQQPKGQASPPRESDVREEVSDYTESDVEHAKEYAKDAMEENTESETQLKELERVAMLYDSIREIHKKRNPSRDHELAKDFDVHLQKVMKELYQIIQNSNAPEALKTINGLKAKYDLFDICLSKLNELVEGDNQEISQLLSHIHMGVRGVVSSIYDVIMLDPPAQLISDSAKGVHKYQLENKKLINMVENLEKEIKNITRINEQNKQRFEHDRKELQEQINSLESENKKYLDTLIKHSKGEISNIAPALSARPSSKGASNEITNRMSHGAPYESSNRAFQKSPPKIPKTKEFTYSKYSSGRNSRGITSSMSGKPSYKPTGVGSSIGQTQMRNLSLKQLKEVINDIYTQKEKYDKKCEENKLPRETMEQYMYTYLNQRYGLKNLIIEWAASIINGIKKYSKEDHAVSLFGKILRNECDEEFRFIQMHVQDTLNTLLRGVLKEKYPHKSEQGITQLYDQITNGFIDDFYWARIIERMYDEQDCYTLEEIFRTIIQNRQQSRFSARDSSRSGKRKLTREERMALVTQKDSDKLMFSEFTKAVLDFQLKEHEKFLYKFIVVFKQVDQDNNGVLNEEEFVELVRRMRICEEDENEITRFLEVVDPYNNQEITFSEIVHLLSAHMVNADDPDNPDRTIPILERFAKDERFGQQME